MKPVRRMDSTSQSCSCTSCLYKSESEQPSIRKYIAHGSRIDRLYYGKYIPLRERKLLNRLVRTRAVYDDLRARLISDSTLSLDKNADLRPRKHHHAIKTLENSEKSGAILELVDYIDKGAVPKKLSECCSCCSCSSKMKIMESERKVHKYKRPHMRGYEREYAERLHGAVGERYHKRGVRFKAKHVRSDPCTCTFKFSGLIKKHSKAMIRKLRPLPLEPFQTEDLHKESKLQNFARKSYQKYKNLQDKLDQDIKKLNESKENLIENLQLKTEKSLQQMKQVKDKVKTNIELGIQKSIQALKPKDREYESIEYEEDKAGFKIKKDSIIKFKDYLKRKELMKDWECDYECEQDTCVPEECFKIIKLKRVRKRDKQRREKLLDFQHQKVVQDIHIGEKSSKKSSSSSVQAEQMAVNIATHTKKPVLRVEEGNKVMAQRYIFETKEVKTPNIKQSAKDIMKFQKGKSEKAVDLETPPLKLVRNTKVLRNMKQARRRKHEAPIENETIVKPYHSRSRQAVRIGSSFGFDLEFYKTKPDQTKAPNTSNKRNIKYASKLKHTKVHRHHKGSQVILNPSIEGTPSKEYKIKKNHSDANSSVSYKMKSVSSITRPGAAIVNKKISTDLKRKDYSSQASLIPTNHKLVTNELPTSLSHKQAVRIGSSFSFNVEFYKKDIVDEVTKSSVLEETKQKRARPSTVLPKVKKQKIKQTRSKKNILTHETRDAKTFSIKEKYKETKNNLTRWSKLHKFRKPKRKINTSSTGTTTSHTFKTKVDKNVGTTRNNRLQAIKMYLPYECEPGVCIPDECDPIQCHKIIKLRNKKQKFRNSKVSYTTSRKTKSTSSAVSNFDSSVRAKIVQSSPISTNSDKVSKIYKEKTLPYRQAVRIGSSFSFNIEFYKDKQAPMLKETVSSISKLHNYTKSINQEDRYQEDGRNKNNRSTRMMAQFVNLDKSIGPSLKRCFCTLKLYKNTARQKLEKKKGKTANTQTFNEGVSIIETVNKGTRTKRNQAYELLPYECEPYFCIPGECDPFLCLENINQHAIKTREYGIFTDKPNMKSISSLTGNMYQRSTATLVQPQMLRKGTNIRQKHFSKKGERPTETNPYIRESGESFNYTNSKQAVRIGSSFNFSIEFSKQLPDTLNLMKQPKLKTTPQYRKKIYKNMGTKVKKINVDHVDTQSQAGKKVHKSLLVRPLLKRCFCTLNLQKRIKEQHNKRNFEGYHFAPKMYTIGRAMTNTKMLSQKSIDSEAKIKIIGQKRRKISISTSSFLLRKCFKNSFLHCGTLKLEPVMTVPTNIMQPIKLNSNLSVEIKFLKNFCPFGLYDIKRPIKSFSSACMDKMTEEILSTVNRPYNQQKLTCMNHYWEQCFCTMNVQISHEKHDRKYLNSYLKPYECEPGICTPGECNPYECQKLIMKRFMRRANKGSSTQVNNQSVSSYGPQLVSESKSTQLKTNVTNHSQGLKPQKYAPQKQLRERNQRQAVRIGSSFSFDIEFSKSRSLEKNHKFEETYKYLKTPAKQRKYLVRSEDAQGITVSRKSRQSQSMGRSVHKASNYTPTTKRCFCTLKLQKKGRIHQQNITSNTLPIRPPSSILSRNIKVGTKQHNFPKLYSYNLKSYECEPGICIPGECNAYECLEIMKKRKDFGINATGFSQRSISSMTSGRDRISRAVHVKPNKRYKKTTKTNQGVISPKNSNAYLESRQPRQAVRIGSNFSFSVEFFKDKPEIHEMNENLNNAKVIKPISKMKEKNRQYKEFNVRNRSNITQSTINFNNKETQIKSPTDEVSTMTSLIKRCFCTAKLREKNLEKGYSTTFKQKCFCLLGLRNKGPNDVKPFNNIIPTVDKHTNTQYKPKIYKTRLKPYECEPGICIPGQCDPYLCHSIIQRRMTRQFSKASETDLSKAKSVSSSLDYVMKPKHEGTQSRIKKNYKQKQYVNKDKRKSTVNTDRRVVRIGSNFSFNVEFYKDLNRNNAKEGRITEVNSIKNIYKTNTTKNRKKSIGIESKAPSEHTQSQNEEKKMRTLGISPVIRRCFCTLKFLSTNQKQKANKDKINVVTTKNIKTQSDEVLKIQPQKIYRGGDILSPYECEPLTCIPGECNPVECLERIEKRRQYTKDYGTGTGHPRRKSVGSTSARTKDRHLQANFFSASPTTVQKANYVNNSKLVTSGDLSRRAVRIGSNFSFNIDFYKEGGETVSKELPDLEIIKQSRISDKKNHKTTTPSHVHSVNAQVTSIKTKSAGTGSPNLKRCFCTLQLQNKNLTNRNDLLVKKQTAQPKSEYSAVGQFLKRCVCAFKINKVGKLQNEQLKTSVKYEMKGTSTINHNGLSEKKFKFVRLLEPYECEPNICIPGECDPYECLKRIKKRQVRDFGTGYKRNLKDSATDSIKRPVTKNQQAQYLQKQKFQSQSTLFPLKRKRRSKEVTQYVPQSSGNVNRNAVRIGSNFSFNIEFFQEHGPASGNEYKKFKPKNMPKFKRRSEKLQVKSRGFASAHKNFRCQSSQCPFLKEDSASVAASATPKRCFCTLNLLKTNNAEAEQRYLNTLKATEDKMTATQKKYLMPYELGVYECPPEMCIPGECDPFECLDKMKRRGIIQKSRYVGTKARNTSVASGRNRLHSDVQKIQVDVNKRDVVSLISSSKPKSPYITNNMDKLNKSAVRIGSNFNFNVEFFKQKSQPAVIRSHKIVRGRSKVEDSKSHMSKTVAAKKEKLRHRNLQASEIKTKDQASDAGKMLKRCFCTLQLQNQKRKMLPENKAPGINVQYPQIVTVGRVEVYPYNKNLTKNKQIGRVDKVKSTLTDPKLLHNTRTVATKTNSKYLHTKGLNLLQCNPTNCPEYKNSLAKSKKSNMETILPYTPSKFNKKESKTLVSNKDKLKKLYDKCDTANCEKGKRLTPKKSEKSIPGNKLKTIRNSKKSFLCRCASLFSKETESKSLDKKHIINYENPQVKLTVIPKNKKNVARKMDNENCSDFCPDYNNISRKKFGTKLESGDTGTDIVKTQGSEVKVFKNKFTKSKERNVLQREQPKLKVTFADSTTHLNEEALLKGKVKKSLHHKSNTRKLCYSCSLNDCPLRSGNVNNFDRDEERKGVFHLFANCLKKRHKTVVMHSESADNCQYCECCKRKIHADEMSKGAGDRRVNVNAKKDKCCVEKKTSKEISNNFHVIGEQKQGQLSKTKLKHDNLCNCCKCIEKRKKQGAKISVPANSNFKITNTIGKIFPCKKVQEPTETAKLSNKPCICGSKICAKESKKKQMTTKDTITFLPGKPCDCGSSICTRESKKMRQKRELVCKCEETMAKRVLQEQKRQDLIRRLNIEEEKDEKRRLKRMKRNKKLEKRLKKYKHASDLVLATHSLVDVGKLGFSTVTGAVCATAKAIRDPRLAYERMKFQNTDPDALIRRFEKKYKDSDAAATAKRLKTRCRFMKIVKNGRKTLEENRFTHYLIHVADSNPKTRKFKRKPVRRRREPLDFDCSLYMASLRKRPYLCVYYKCPWFYPHFITMLNILKQFTDILLFLLAAAVWSPCILCMEGCRAMLCCFFCTG